jgi:hypothetical protein
MAAARRRKTCSIVREARLARSVAGVYGVASAESTARSFKCAVRIYVKIRLPITFPLMIRLRGLRQRKSGGKRHKKDYGKEEQTPYIVRKIHME